jgi:hypothetical protein
MTLHPTTGELLARANTAGSTRGVPMRSSLSRGPWQRTNRRPKRASSGTRTSSRIRPASCPRAARPSHPAASPTSRERCPPRRESACPRPCRTGRPGPRRRSRRKSSRRGHPAASPGRSRGTSNSGRPRTWRLPRTPPPQSRGWPPPFRPRARAGATRTPPSPRASVAPGTRSRT